MFQGVDHVVVAVKDLDAAIKQYETLYGVPVSDRGEPPGAGFKNAHFRFGETFIELISPLSEEGPVARRLAQSGDGAYLVAMRVDNLERAAPSVKLTSSGRTACNATDELR